jgi:[ribosomal protein S5]-alanine N-acetyltransferase
MAIPQEIQTERLTLRPSQISDAEKLFARYGHDAQVCRSMSWTPHRTVDDTVAYLERSIADEQAGKISARLIFERESGQLLGSVGGQWQGHRIQFGYCLARDAWGRGFATEAASAFVAAAMQEPAIYRVQAFCDLENRASARVLEKVGLTLEGTLRRYLVLPNLGPEPRDVFCYAIIRRAEGNWPIREIPVVKDSALN